MPFWHNNGITIRRSCDRHFTENLFYVERIVFFFIIVNFFNSLRFFQERKIILKFAKKD